jgi:hypothetical protein
MSGKLTNPYEIELTQSGNPNLIYARSSDSYTTYAVYFAGPTEVTCTCEGFSRGYSCRHRKSVMFSFQYVPEDVVFTDAEWQEIQSRIEELACKEAADELFGSEAA